MKNSIYLIIIFLCLQSFSSVNDNIDLNSTVESESSAVESSAVESSIDKRAIIMDGVPLYQYHRTIARINHYYYDTRSSVERDKGKRDGIVCIVQKDGSAAETVPLYQYQVPRTNRFFYTTERMNLNGWVLNGVVCYIFNQGGPMRKPLYMYQSLDVYSNLYYYLDTRSIAEPDKGMRIKIVGYVY